MSRHVKQSARDPALTVGYGWDPGLASFYAWAGPDEGDCDPEELVLDIGNHLHEIDDPRTLSTLLDGSGHGALTPDEVQALCGDHEREGETVRSRNLQVFLDGMGGTP